MARIKDSSVDAVKAAAEILPLVEDYVRLRKAGGTYKGLCPFHQEKTPSFTVSPARGTFKCFGCGEGGDAIAFVEKLESVDFVGAIETLAQRFGVQIEYEEISPEADRARKRKERLTQLMERATVVLRARALGHRAGRVRARVSRVTRTRRRRVPHVPARLRARRPDARRGARCRRATRRRTCSPAASSTAAATTTSRGVSSSRSQMRAAPCAASRRASCTTTIRCRRST